MWRTPRLRVRALLGSSPIAKHVLGFGRPALATCFSGWILPQSGLVWAGLQPACIRLQAGWSRLQEFEEARHHRLEGGGKGCPAEAGPYSTRIAHIQDCILHFCPVAWHVFCFGQAHAYHTGSEYPGAPGPMPPEMHTASNHQQTPDQFRNAASMPNERRHAQASNLCVPWRFLVRVPLARHSSAAIRLHTAWLRRDERGRSLQLAYGSTFDNTSSILSANA